MPYVCFYDDLHWSTLLFPYLPHTDSFHAQLAPGNLLGEWMIQMCCMWLAREQIINTTLLVIVLLHLFYICKIMMHRNHLSSPIIIWLHKWPIPQLHYVQNINRQLNYPLKCQTLQKLWLRHKAAKSSVLQLKINILMTFTRCVSWLPNVFIKFNKLALES